MTKNQNTRIITAMTVITVLVNACLAAVKLTAGIVAGSYAMVSDAVNSASDVVSAIIILIGVKIASKKADVNHPYGHERFECIASLALSFIMLFTAFEVGKSAITGVTNEAPGSLAVIAAAVSIATKLVLFIVTVIVARKTASSSLKTLSFDHVSDVVATTGGLVGIILARLGYGAFDRVMGFVICLFIAFTALKIFREVTGKLTDEAADKQTEEKIREIISSDFGVTGIDSVNTRKFGDRIYVDIEIAVYRNLSLTEAHEIAERVHDKIESEMPAVKHCTVHVNPAADGDGEE